MQHTKLVMKKGLIGITALFLLVFYPANAFADVTSPTTTPTDTTTQGPTTPPGPDAKTYTYNESTGLWENAYYTWDPVTGQTTPKTAPSYSYNPTTGMWDTTQWKYDAPSGTYVPNVASTTQNPDPTAQPSTTTNTTSSVYDSFYNASISNNVSSTATSGDASVANNTTGGSATSGNSLAESTIVNALQSAGFNTGNMVNFTANIQGDVVGDLLIDPGSLSSVTNAATNNNLTVNNQASGQISNVIDLNAGTGTAVIDSNTTGGNALTGNADAVANVVNLINSVVGSGQSFMGNINIMGNFNGDILLPQAFLDSLLSSNAPVTTLNTSSITNSNVLADVTNNSTITNDVNAAANTGTATVSNNTTAGNATTGNANTNITILNLTGSQVIGKNALLVFVNVLGTWVGMIMNAPGATSAEVGGGISQNTSTNNATVSSTSTNSINNDINVGAHSGDASVTNNTLAGNATSGNATASVNLANILNSSFSLSDWFGVLFINVFGSWTGSFGVNTSAGDLPAPSAIAEAAGNPANVKMFQFIPGGTNNRTTLASVDVNNNGQSSGSIEASHQDKPAVLASANTSGSSPTSTAAAGAQISWMVPFVAMVVGGSLLATDKFVGRRSRYPNLRFTRRGGIDFIEPFKSL